MDVTAAARGAASPSPRAPIEDLDRRFEATILDWQWIVVDGPNVDVDALRATVEDLSRFGFDLAVVAPLSADELDRQLGARPDGPGRLLLCVDGGSAIFEAGPHGLELQHRWDGAASAIGTASQSSAANWVLADLWARGIAPASVFVAGDFDVPDGAVRHRGTPSGEADAFRRFLNDQLHRRLSRDLPEATAAAEWRLTVEGFEPRLERVNESLLTLADGFLGTRGTPLVGDGETQPGVFASGVYEGTGPATELASLPVWSQLADSESGRPSGRTIDLRTGALHEEGPLRSLRFSSLARPGVVAIRARGDRRLFPAAGARTEQAALGLATQDTITDGGFERIGAYASDVDAARDALAAAESVGFEGLLRGHREAWARRWSAADVVVDGDPELQHAIRFSLFHLMSSVPDRGEAAVGARGLSGSAYRGHVFWDSDVFVLPFLAATHPAAARAMLEYRIRRLPAAQEAARVLGRAGARFPWESAAEGVDVTPASAVTPTGARVLIRTGELEEHIVADVAWAAACYIDWTGDTAFADSAGRDLLVETARYWASRVRRDSDGRAHIDDVIGPDEYHEMVDDNAFTNVMARWNLRRAAAVANVAEAERTAWLAVADAMVDGYEPATRVYEQFRGFADLEPILISEIAPRRPIAADLLLGAERTAQAQVIKQPDVLMLHHLVPDEVAPDSLSANLDFYEHRTAHGSSLSPAVHAALLARDRRFEEALHWLRIAARIDLDDLTGSTSGGLHLATMGGLWQAMVHGFAGVRVGQDRIVVDPRMPPQWNGLHVGLCFRGVPFRLDISHGHLEIGTDALELGHVDGHWEVTSR
jgi:trehalose/maltose hydrolase-like predicted phosphorylase